MPIQSNHIAAYIPVATTGYNRPTGNANFGNIYQTGYDSVQTTINQADQTLQFQSDRTQEEIDYQNNRALANRAFTRAINEVSDAIGKTKNAQSTIGGAAGQ